MPSFPCFWTERRDDGIYVRPDTGVIFPHPRDFGVGALYDASWLRSTDSPWAGEGIKTYPDGLTLVVMTPDGPWVIDGPSYDGQQRHPCPWTRTGDPRNPATLSVTPSINFPGRYHGWLKNGMLVDA